MKCNLRPRVLHCALALSLFLSACGGNNGTAATAPNTGNIPKLTTQPSTQASQLKKQRISGEVFDALTGQPLDRAEILLQVTAAGGAATNNTPNNTAPNANPNNPTPPPNAQPTPNPNIPTPPPATSIPAPNSTPAPNATPSPNATPDPNVSPGALPSPQSDVAPPAINNLDSAALPQRYAHSASLVYHGAQANTANQATNNANADDPNLFKAQSNNRGRFFINDVPEGAFVITISLPGYRSLTLTEANPNNLNIPLMPSGLGKAVDVVGMVLSPSEAPVAEAVVSASFPIGSGIGIPALTNDLGEFELPAVIEGERTLLAFTQNGAEKIRQMGFLRNLPIAKKNLKATETVLPPASSTVASPEPTVDPDRRKKLEESVENILKDEPSPEPEGEPTVDPSQEPADTPEVSPDSDSSELTPTPESSAAPEPSGEPSTAPSSSNGLEEIENEEVKEEKTFNLLDTVRKMVTGDDSKEVPSEEFFPVIPLRSVLSEFVLGGTVELPEGYTPKQVEVYLMLPADKEEHRQELFLFSRELRAPQPAGAEGSGKTAQASPSPAASAGPPPKPRFELELPNLEEDHAYHLQFTAEGPDGQLSYHHLYNLNKSDETLMVPIMASQNKIELEDEEINAIPPVPGMAWEVVAGAEIYHVVLEAGKGLDRRVVWEAWTSKNQIRFPLSRPKERLKSKEIYNLSVSALKGLRPAIANSKKQYAHPGYQAIWTDLVRMSHPPFEVVE